MYLNEALEDSVHYICCSVKGIIYKKKSIHPSIQWRIVGNVYNNNYRDAK